MARILVVEDNAELAAGIRYNLELEGHNVRVAEDGEIGVASAREYAPDVIILDVMLPKMDGFQVLRTLRADGITVPVIMLTARGEESDKVRAFRLDADQYVTKPFGLMELIERVSALLRRTQGGSDTAADTVVRIGDVVLEPLTRKVTRAGVPVSLTPRAFDLLVELARLDGKVASRNHLLHQVWGHRGNVLTRTVDSHISELRQKLEADPEHPQHILTVWKVGYRLQK